MAFSDLLRLFALCGLLAHVQNYTGMLALIARLRFDARCTRLLTWFALHSLLYLACFDYIYDALWPLVAWLCLAFLLCLACFLVLNKNFTKELLYKIIGHHRKKVLSSRVFLNQHFENSNPNLKPIRDLLAKPDILRNWVTCKDKFTWRNNRYFFDFIIYWLK